MEDEVIEIRPETLSMGAWDVVFDALMAYSLADASAHGLDRFDMVELRMLIAEARHQCLVETMLQP